MYPRTPPKHPRHSPPTPRLPSSLQKQKIKRSVLESISIAKSLAIKNRYTLNATQELRGLGIANLVGAAFNCYTTTGSFSRSAIMDTVGANTQLAGLVGGLIVMLTLLVLTPLFRLMPNNAQGAIIISAVIGLIQVKEWFFLWKSALRLIFFF